MRNTKTYLRSVSFMAAMLMVLSLSTSTAAQLPGNLAGKADIKADSVYSNDYLPRFLADGKVPMPGSKQDVRKAWCVKGETHRNSATLQFKWPSPVTIGEIIYYARTAWYMNETWRDVEILAAPDGKPVYKGSLKKIYTPQRIALKPPVSTDQLIFRFKSSYGGINPGASEIQVFEKPVPAKALRQFLKAAMPGLPAGLAPHDPASPESIAGLIRHLEAQQDTTYLQTGADKARLAEVSREVKALAGRKDVSDEKLDELQRSALLHDIDKLLVIKRHEIVASHVYTYHYEGFRPGGGLYLVDPRNLDAEPLTLAESPTGQILDCDLSYDGKTVLFSWRRTKEEGYHLWSINVDGTGLKRLGDGRWNDYNGCWLPDGGIAFLSTRAPQFAYCWHAPVGIVYRMNADGTDVRKLSSNYLNDFTPYPLNNGRIIYTRWEYVDKPAIPIQSLWTINPDGTGLSHYFGNNVLSPGTFMEARSIPGTHKIICTMTGHNGPTRGAIGVIDRNLGLNAQAAITNITPDVPLPAVNKGNGNTGGSKQYSCPLPLDKLRFLVSIRGPILARTLDGQFKSIVLPAPGDGMQYFNAQPVAPRHRPQVIPATITASGQQKKYGFIYLQDIYKGMEGHVAKGEIKRLRIIRELEKAVRIDPSLRSFGFQFPVISCGATYAGKQVLGEVNVSDDGSAFFKVPAGMPLYFMALDAQGRSVQRMRSFTHLMPGEYQGCVGCHESRHSTPRPMQTALYNRPCQDPEPPEWGIGGFDYSRIVQPILDKNCTSCHNPKDAPKGIDLTGDVTDYFNVSYDVLARENQGARGSPYISWIPTYNGQEQNILERTPKAWGSPKSKLADVILSGHPDKDGKPRINLDEKSRRRILAWIDLNVPYYGSSETAHPALQGCRRMYPKNLDKVLADVGKRRCSGCHDKGRQGNIPRRAWTRITNPHLNPFLLAPLAKTGGGTERCGKAVFKRTDDPDYQAILKTFGPVLDLLAKTPRMDMPGGKPEPTVCRDCQ